MNDEANISYFGDIRRFEGQRNKFNERFKTTRPTIWLPAEFYGSAKTVVRPGDLDLSFGDEGRLVGEFSGLGLPTHNNKYWILSNLQSDTTGKIHIKQVRNDGSIDTGPNPPFPPEGRIVGVHLDGNLYISKAALQSDGSIVIIGDLYAPPSRATFVMRITPDGNLDTNFGDRGIKLIEFTDNPITAIIGAFTIQPDDKIVVAMILHYLDTEEIMRSRVIRLTATEGKLDTDFNGGGIGEDLPPSLIVNKIAVLNDSKLLLAGFRYPNATLARLNARGTIDMTFGDEGIVALPERENAAMEVFSLALYDDDSVALAGRIGFDEAELYWVGKVLPSGEPDDKFNEGNVLLINHGISTIATQNEKLVLHGFMRPDEIRMYVLRLTNEGSPDVEFGGGGMVVAPSHIHAPDVLFRSHSFVQEQEGKATLFVSDMTMSRTETDPVRKIQTQLVRFMLS